MEREFRKVFGKQLRKEFRVSGGLPTSIGRALSALASKHSNNDNLPAVAGDLNGATDANAPLARNGD